MMLCPVRYFGSQKRAIACGVGAVLLKVVQPPQPAPDEGAGLRHGYRVEPGRTGRHAE